MEKQHRNVLVLSGCQATMQTITASMVSVTGLAGFLLAENKGLATVPLTCYVLGSAITTIPASMLMKAVGRRAGFQAGTVAGMVSAAVCAAALYLSVPTVKAHVSRLFDKLGVTNRVQIAMCVHDAGLI